MADDVNITIETPEQDVEINVEDPGQEDINLQIKTAESEANRAKQEADRAEQAAEDAREDLDAAVTEAVRTVNKAVDTKRNELNAIKTSADQSAATAMRMANQATAAADDANNMIRQQNKKITALENSLGDFVANGYVEDGTGIFLNKKNETLFTMRDIGGGGGGGGGGGEVITAVMKMESTTGWSANSYAPGADVEITFRWSSIDDELETGPGSLQILVNGVVRSTLNVQQGDVTVNVKEFMKTGENEVQLALRDSLGQLRRKFYTITIVQAYLTSTFNDSVEQVGQITVPYTPYGDNLDKTVYFEVDGTVVDQIVTGVSGSERTEVFPAMEHGVHRIRIWFEATLNGTLINENGRDFSLNFEITCVESGNTDVIIACDYAGGTIMQYTTLTMMYRVYDPVSQTADVDILIDGTVVSELKGLNREKQPFSWRFDEVGTHTVVFRSGETQRDPIQIVVESANIDVEAETQNLALYLSSHGRSNAEANPGTWTYGTAPNKIECAFTGFNFKSDGWQLDEDGVTVLRVNGDARLTIPYKLFEHDFRTTGKTIEVEFATRDVRNYSDVLISCMNGGRGIEITAQECLIAGEKSVLTAQFKENEHIRVSFVVEKAAGLRLIRCYINGILSRVVRYPGTENFQQGVPADIVIGNDEATIDLYCIRVYDNDLIAQQIVNNWIADTQDGPSMVYRYNHNNVLDGYGKIVINKLPNDLPYFVIECPQLPQSKGDKKKNVTGRFVNPADHTMDFTYTGAEIDVQGTSSQFYYRKNYKIKFKGGMINSKGQEISKYQINKYAIPVSTFCFKADVASSEGANNVELARLYNDICPYRTPAQVENQSGHTGTDPYPMVRQGIDGFPMVIFWTNTDSGETMFLGKYNFNNDKGTEEVFGFVDGDESWETKNHDGERIIYKSDDFTDGVWQNDYEARYPDEDPPYEDITQLREFVHWVVTTDTATATGDALESSVTYDGTTYTHDTAEYRLAKFKNELGNYCEIQSAEFFYLFTEVFLLADNRAKNQFISFMGEEVNA